MTQVSAHPSTEARSAHASGSTRHRWIAVNREGLAYRGGVLVRAVAAIVGGYVLSALVAALLALGLPGARVEAALAGTLVAVLVYPCVVMWVFAVDSARRAVLGLLVPGLVLGAVLWGWLRWGGAA